MAYFYIFLQFKARCLPLLFTVVYINICLWWRW